MGETSLLLLAPLYAGPWLLACGFRGARETAEPAPSGERAAWRALWSPLWVPGLLLALLTGFGLEELGDSLLSVIDGPEGGLRPAAILLALPFALIWVRALWRAVATALQPAPRLAAATVGLWRPRSAISSGLATLLSEAELAAVTAHEAAHARHRDPLRIWLAQLATDLQWPSPQAPRRLARWREALELARDDEARGAGADDTALASALVAAVRFAQTGVRLPNHVAAMAHPASSGEALRRRVRWLLEARPQAAVAPEPAAWLPWLALLATVALGAAICDRLLPLLPGVGG
jgi:hypothetical protein